MVIGGQTHRHSGASGGFGDWVIGEELRDQKAEWKNSGAVLDEKHKNIEYRIQEFKNEEIKNRE